LLSDDAAEGQESPMAVGLGERLPEAGQRDAPGRLRWARGGTGRAGWVRMIVLRAEAVLGEVGSNLPASRAPEPQLWGSAQRIDKAKLPVESVCVFCNAFKGPNLTGLDPATGKITRLYHPRQHKWTYHFRFQGSTLIGRRAIGRTTIDVLQMNHPEIVALRDILMEGGIF
jgi:hypothetical protein